MTLGKFALPLALVAAGMVSAGAAVGAGTGGLVAGEAAPPPGPGLDLINERCGFCHTTAQTLDVRKTPAGWALAVQSMIDRGADLTPEEQQIVVEYLAANRALGNAGSAHATAPASPSAEPVAPMKH